MGPLTGIRIVELGAIGPAPFAGMLFADLGAEVLRLDQPQRSELVHSTVADPVLRGRPTLEVDLKSPAGRRLALAVASRADALIEGFRPGVLERLGLGPDVLHAANCRLIIGRITGYGQEGPLAHKAGHDINYISTAGVLSLFARTGDRPLFPVNLVGDYGGGGMLVALGVLAALLEANRSGRGQVVDAAMVDGAALLATAIYGLRAGGAWSDEAGTNVLDSGAHFYEVYETSDGGHFAVGAIEPHFYAQLLDVLGLDAETSPQWDRVRWPELKARFAEIFQSRTRDEWTQRFAGADACATPVLTSAEAPVHGHNASRGTFVDLDGVVQPQAAPRFSRTPATADRPQRSAHEILASWGVTPPAGIADT